MAIKIKFLSPLVAFVLLAGCSVLNLNPAGPVLGQQAPAFGAHDINGVFQDLKQYRGRPVVLIFWSMQDTLSKTEIRPLKSVYDAFYPKGAVFLSINLDTDLVEVKNFVYTQKIPFPVICDRKAWDGKIVSRYRVTYTPQYVLIDWAGNVIYQADWAKEMELELKKILP